MPARKVKFNFKLSDGEKERLKELAHRDGRTMGDWLRTKIREKHRALQLELFPHEVLHGRSR